MKIYYLQSEYQPGKHRIVTTVYDVDAIKYDASNLSAHSVMMIDEATNQVLCIDLYRTVNRTDVNGNGKYYIDNLGALMQVAGWTEHIPVRI